MAGLRARVVPYAVTDGALRPLFELIWSYLHRAAPRLERLLARWRAGTLGPSRPSRAGIVRQPATGRARLPNCPAWLVRLIQPTAQFRPQLEALMARPEMIELLAAAPQAGRILRPLFRMLGTDPLPEVLRLPGAPPPPLGPVMPRRKRTWPQDTAASSSAPWSFFPAAQEKITPA